MYRDHTHQGKLQQLVQEIPQGRLRFRLMDNIENDLNVLTIQNWITKSQDEASNND